MIISCILLFLLELPVEAGSTDHVRVRGTLLDFSSDGDWATIQQGSGVSIRVPKGTVRKPAGKGQRVDAYVDQGEFFTGYDTGPNKRSRRLDFSE